MFKCNLFKSHELNVATPWLILTAQFFIIPVSKRAVDWFELSGNDAWNATKIGLGIIAGECIAFVIGWWIRSWFHVDTPNKGMVGEYID